LGANAKPVPCSTGGRERKTRPLFHTLFHYNVRGAHLSTNGNLLKAGLDMIVLVGAFLVSLIPSFAIFFWVRSLKRDASYKSNCNKALLYGLGSTFLAVLFSLVLNVTEALSGIRGVSPLATDAFHTFLVLALCEEVAKFLVFRHFVKRTSYPFSWLDLIATMIIVGIGFEVLESLIYAFGSGVPHMLVRGITAMHVSYAFIMGYFYGKAQHTGQKSYIALAIGLPWIMHGAYDFGLRESLLALDEAFALLPLSLAALSVVLIVVMIVFMRKRRGNDVYTLPLQEFAQNGEETEA